LEKERRIIMEIVYKKVNDLIPYENNPRINDEAVEYVKNSIKEFGFKVPIVIDKNNVIVAGHTRLKASLELGYKEVPCIIADDLSEEQVKAFRLADNKISEKSQWDFSKLDEELDSILDIDMSMFDFIENEIDWDNVDDLTEETYDKPEHNMLECPNCHHIDRDIHFKKVNGVEDEN
jgi:ParB-like chromosome segregation protein Spo0J